jgi:hypothetical protein
VLAVAEHDNGWWEWEADPALSQKDGMPEGLSEVLKDPVVGMQRWRQGIPRFSERHPYASLLISDHAYWLYAAQFLKDAPEEFTHALQRTRRRYPEELESEARRFMAEVESMQSGLQDHVVNDAVWSGALASQHRFPHARLLQTLDAMSLALCSDVLTPVESGEAQGLGEDRVVFDHVPRKNWADRVSIRMDPAGSGRIHVEPYPFDIAPLTVGVPVRIVTTQIWWREAPLTMKQFTFV